MALTCSAAKTRRSAMAVAVSSWPETPVTATHRWADKAAPADVGEDGGGGG